MKLANVVENLLNLPFHVFMILLLHIEISVTVISITFECKMNIK